MLSNLEKNEGGKFEIDVFAPEPYCEMLSGIVNRAEEIPSSTPYKAEVCKGDKAEVEIPKRSELNPQATEWLAKGPSTSINTTHTVEV